MTSHVTKIRKYKNRRLYDTDRSEYITKEELFRMVQDGQIVQVQEVDTGEDVTVEMLLQLMVSDCRETLQLIPSELIHFLISTRSSILKHFFEHNYPTYKAMYDQSNNAFPGANMMGQFMTPHPFTQMFNPANFGFGGPAQGNMAPGNVPVPPESSPKASKEDPREEELKELRERLKSLEDRMK